MTCVPFDKGRLCVETGIFHLVEAPKGEKRAFESTRPLVQQRYQLQQSPLHVFPDSDLHFLRVAFYFPVARPVSRFPLGLVFHSFCEQSRHRCAFFVHWSDSASRNQTSLCHSHYGTAANSHHYGCRSARHFQSFPLEMSWEKWLPAALRFSP